MSESYVSYYYVFYRMCVLWKRTEHGRELVAACSLFHFLFYYLTNGALGRFLCFLSPCCFPVSASCRYGGCGKGEILII